MKKLINSILLFVTKIVRISGIAVSTIGTAVFSFLTVVLIIEIVKHTHRGILSMSDAMRLDFLFAFIVSSAVVLIGTGMWYISQSIIEKHATEKVY